VTDSDWQRLAAVGSATVLGHRRRGHLQFASGPLPQQQSSLGCAVLYESTVRGTPFWPVHTVLCTYNVLQRTVHTVHCMDVDVLSLARGTDFMLGEVSP
jgi:hypothetical protein